MFWPGGMWDLSSLTRDRTCTPCTTGPPGKSLCFTFCTYLIICSFPRLLNVLFTNFWQLVISPHCRLLLLAIQVSSCMVPFPPILRITTLVWILEVREQEGGCGGNCSPWIHASPFMCCSLCLGVLLLLLFLPETSLFPRLFSLIQFSYTFFSPEMGTPYLARTHRFMTRCPCQSLQWKSIHTYIFRWKKCFIHGIIANPCCYAIHLFFR